MKALSKREVEMLRLLATGSSNLDIARLLDKTQGTIVQYVHTLMKKLGARNRTHAVARAIALGIIPADSALSGFKGEPRLDTSPIEELSPRESEVILLVSRGATNRMIADALIIEEVTVKRHMQNVLGKLGARNRHEAVVIAHHAGML